MKNSQLIQNLAFSRLLERYPALQNQEGSILAAINVLAVAIENNQRLWVFGNGGSCADAEHFCGELTKGFTNSRKLTQRESGLLDQIDPELKQFVQGGISAIALSTQSSSLSAFSNDIDFKYA